MKHLFYLLLFVSFGGMSPNRTIDRFQQRSKVSFNSVLGSGTGKIFSYRENMTHGNTTDYPLIVRNPR